MESHMTTIALENELLRELLSRDDIGDGECNVALAKKTSASDKVQ
jgi:hypothetical protein